MKSEQTLIDLKSNNVEFVMNRPAISGFRDRMSIGGIIKDAFITPKFFLHKHNTTCTGIGQIYEEYKDKNVIFVGEGGCGKTSVFLRLYMGIGDDNEDSFDKDFFYCYVPDLDLSQEKKSKSKYYGYYKALKRIVDAGTGLNGILLLDGLEEAYLDNSERASALIAQLGESNIHFWVSCRSSYYGRLDENIDSYFAEKVEVLPWKDDEYKVFISRCLEDNNKRNAVINRIDRIAKPIKSLLTRPLFATMILFVAESDDLENVHNEYELISLFIDKWLEREKQEKKVVYETSFEGIRNAALSLYKKTSDLPKYTKDLRAFRDLLVLTGVNGGTIHKFYHQELQIYFISNAMLDAALEHPALIVKWFSQTFYDDITNMIKPELLQLGKEQCKQIYDNLFAIYKRSYEDSDSIVKELKEIEDDSFNPEESFLRLRDELMYFIFRLPHIDHKEFAQYAYTKSKDTMLFLGIAYGMARIDPSNAYTIEFAKKLTPGSQEDVRNRGWGLCFFGDVEENGYTYEDSEGKPWNKIRENRLNRLKDNAHNHVETRVLDIPLLYCFYHSRGFADCTSYSDYNIIRQTDISLPCFGAEQKAFMEEQKQKLVSKYRELLLLKEICNRADLVSSIDRKCIIMDRDANKIYLEIDDTLAQKILKICEHKDAVLKNMKAFWDEKGSRIVEAYKSQIEELPKHKNLKQQDFKKQIQGCKVLIITANTVEGAVVSKRLLQASQTEEPEMFVTEGYSFQFATVESVPVLHVWPSSTSSFTQYGSFNAINTALKYFTPQYVISLGVAFGINPLEQSLGDVLISKELVFYDNFNKVTDGIVTLKKHEAYSTDVKFHASVRQLEFNNPPKEVGDFKWYYDALLTGGTVLSDTAEKLKLLEAAADRDYSNIVGGEMEATGIYYACQVYKDRSIPFIVIKGICDWGAEKNGWEKVVGSQTKEYRIKDCVQAYACNNAYDTMSFVLSQLPFR